MVVVLIVTAFFRIRKRNKLIIFLAVYLISTWWIIPAFAPHFGRVALPNHDRLVASSPFTRMLNRHYVTPQMLSVLLAAAEQQPRGYIGYLDANFPFFDGFPLLPHLSHSDGKKIDLAYYYQTSTGKPTKKIPSWMGYGVYEAPKNHETQQPQQCANAGFWQYSFAKWLSPLPDRSLTVDSQATANLLRSFNQSGLKIFLEPHLKTRWSLQNQHNIRYHGCHAVRHDDHIHLQIQ